MKRDMLVELIESGLSTSKIARECGICQTVVRYWLTKYGLKTKFIYHGKTRPDRFCINCGKMLTSLKARIYCGAKCQNEYKWMEKRKEYERTGIIQCPITNLHNVRRFLLEKHGNVCSVCGNTEWMGKPIPLVCDHINGDPYDNRIINLRLVCANCDAQLPTYKSKNRGKGRKTRRSSNSVGRMPTL